MVDGENRADKIEISCKKKEMSVEQLVKYITKTFDVSVDRIFAYGDSEDRAIYNSTDRNKLDWDIHFGEDGRVTVSDGVFTLWPQVRMAVQMLDRLPPTSGQRGVFKAQVERVKKALDQTKNSFMKTFTGKVSDVYYQVYRPSEEGEKQDYFNKVFELRDYVTLGIDCHSEAKDDVTLPCIKYIFTHVKSSKCS